MAKIDFNEVNITLYDISGHEVQQWTAITSAANEINRLAIKVPLLDGLYLIKIQSNTINYSIKILHVK